MNRGLGLCTTLAKEAHLVKRVLSAIQDPVRGWSIATPQDAHKAFAATNEMVPNNVAFISAMLQGVDAYGVLGKRTGVTDMLVLARPDNLVVTGIEPSRARSVAINYHHLFNILLAEVLIRGPKGPSGEQWALRRRIQAARQTYARDHPLFGVREYVVYELPVFYAVDYKKLKW
jgi:hypothetical protein